MRGGSDLAKELNNQLQTHKLRILKAYDDLMKQDSVFSSRAIIERYKGKQIEVKGIIEALEHYNNDIEAKIGIEAAKSTHKKYKSFKCKLQGFIRHQYKRDNVALIDLN